MEAPPPTRRPSPVPRSRRLRLVAVLAALACAAASGGTLRASADEVVPPATDPAALLQALEKAAAPEVAPVETLRAALAELERRRSAALAEVEALDRRIEILRRASAAAAGEPAPAAPPTPAPPQAVAEPPAEANVPAPPAPAAEPAPAEPPPPPEEASGQPAVEPDGRPVADAPSAKTVELPPVESPPAESPATEFDAAAVDRFAARFAETLWPLLDPNSPASSCGECHGPTTKTPLEIPAEPREAFLRLLRQDYFDAESPSGLLAKVSAPSEEGRMPPKGYDPWGEDAIVRTREFATALYDARRASLEGDGPRPDERFPMELAAANLAPEELAALAHAAPPAPTHNTFLSYRQLRGKVKAIFDDEWIRSQDSVQTDLFHANIAQFGGADFRQYFSENSNPTASYLAALDAMARDVASKAWLNRTGPFADWPAAFAPPDADRPSAEYRDAIARLHERILLRKPTVGELADAYALIREVHAAALSEPSDPAEPRSHVVRFELEVRGDSGPATTREIDLEVREEPFGYRQTWIDTTAPVPPWIVRTEIGDGFDLAAGDAGRGQRFSLTNAGSRGRVVFAGIDLVGPEAGTGETRSIPADDPSARISGPWQFREAGGVALLDDGGDNKGDCVVEIPLNVDAPGRYRVFAKWTKLARKGTHSDMADRVLAEVVAPGESSLAMPPLPERPPPGEAWFFVDQTIDSRPHVDLRTSFRFETPEHGVEIRNAGTTRRVVADAVRFLPVANPGAGEILIDDPAAEGLDGWPIFKDYPFRPYNIVGADARSDDNARKGELAIAYRPAKDKLWSKDEFYGVRVVYPGQASNETRTPVVVKAAASSPVVEVAHPDRAPVGARVALDASGAYDIQGGELKFRWTQIGGPKVDLDDPTAPRVEFTARAPEPTQLAWEGLARALVAHPDFVFSRPPSMDAPLSEPTRARTLLTKIAQDLVARPPSPEELARLDEGAAIETFVDEYLASAEFRDFYFRRIRLLLESHGTPEDDEPVRLWGYVAFEDRPFSEILTADYTVNEAMERIDRPAYHGSTGLLTMKGFIKGKPGLPHFNYAAQVAEKFLGYVFEVPPEIVQQREVITAASTTNPTTVCYSCHKILTPLAHQRLQWDDAGRFRRHDERGAPIDAGDRNMVPSYPFRGEGMEAFAREAVRKERFVRTMIDTHFNFFFGRPMRWDGDEQFLYRRLWDAVHAEGFRIRGLVRAIVLSPEYRGDVGAPAAPSGDVPAPEVASRASAAPE